MLTVNENELDLRKGLPALLSCATFKATGIL